MQRIAGRARCVWMALILISAALPMPSGLLAQRESTSTAARGRVRGGAPRDGVVNDSGARDTVLAGQPVVFADDTLFRLFGNLGPFSPAARATTVNAQLRAATPAFLAGDSVVVTDRGAYTELAVNGVVLMTVLDADAAPIGTTRQVLAVHYAEQLREAAMTAGRRTSTRALLLDAVYAVLATAILVLLLRLLAMGFPRLYARIEALRLVTLPAIRIQEFELLSAGGLSALLIGTARVLRIVVTLLLLYIYVPLVLSFFPATVALSNRIVGYALRPFAAAWLGFITYVPNLFYLAAGIIIVRYLLKLLSMLFTAVSTGAIQFEGFYADWAAPTYKIVRVLVFAFAAMLLYPYLPGASSDAFKGVSLFVGVLFSIGSSGAIGNMVSGVVLTYTRAFQIGDRVRIGETEGDVVEKTLLVTRLRTIKNVAVTIPNGSVLGGQVINYSAMAATRGLILHTGVTIGYDVPWMQVHRLLIEAAGRTEHILPDPVPFVLQTGLDDFYVAYELNATTDRPDRMAVTYSALHQHIQDTFAEGGVEIMSPHYGALRNGNQTTIPVVAGTDR